MNILIPDSWLREHLLTKATPEQIKKYLSLAGPSVERLKKVEGDYVYDIEVTTNRVDAMSVRGIAREAAAILPRFGVRAKLKPLSLTRPRAAKTTASFKVEENAKLEKRMMGVVIDNIKNRETPGTMKRRLELSGIRPLNAIVDITNCVMLETGHPTHAFDYDKIARNKFRVRESKKGEKITTLNGKTHSLPAGAIVFEDANGSIVDLPGIMGTKNSVVDHKTKRVLFFIDNNDPVRIRKTSMALGIRTLAAILNEKGVDPELAETALFRGIELYQKICGGVLASKIYDYYPKKYKAKNVSVEKNLIDMVIGAELPKSDISKYLSALEFSPDWSSKSLRVTVPSFRAYDINIPEDIIEEVARIYGYHNLPSVVPSGFLPPIKSILTFESKVRSTLKELGGVEVMTLSFADRSMVNESAVPLKNPMGKDTKYIRTSLRPSLTKALKGNSGWVGPIHMFELAHVYQKTKRLPNEILTLGGIFRDYDYREAKGIVEEVLVALNIKKGLDELGTFEVLSSNTFYYELDMESLYKLYSPISSYSEIPQFPPQVEDITAELANVSIVDVIKTLEKEKFVSWVELTDVYKTSYTFRVWYQHPKKTLTDKEVTKIRAKLVTALQRKFGGGVK